MTMVRVDRPDVTDDGKGIICQILACGKGPQSWSAAPTATKAHIEAPRRIHDGGYCLIADAANLVRLGVATLKATAPR
jgi:hypothetical protein